MIALDWENVRGLMESFRPDKENSSNVYGNNIFLDRNLSSESTQKYMLKNIFKIKTNSTYLL